MQNFESDEKKTGFGTSASSPLISVVMPVYNSEEYLPKTLDCLKSQTLRDIEFIFVDDGSTDSSLGILRDFAETDSRARVLALPHKNAGAARNAGLDLASGKYLSFLDSDDAFELDMLETAYNLAEVHKAEIVIWQADSFSAKDGRQLKSEYIDRRRLPKEEVFAIRDLADEDIDFTGDTIWDKLFLKAFIDKFGIKFQEQRKRNDGYFCNCSCIVADKIVYSPRVMLHHFKGKTTQLTEQHDIAFEEFCELRYFEGVIDFIDRTPSVSNRMRDNTAAHLFSVMWYMLKAAGKLFDAELRDLIRSVISRKVSKRDRFSNISDFLFWNDVIAPGFIANYFKNPIQLDCSPEFLLPSSPNLMGAKIALYGAGFVGVDFAYQLLSNQSYNLASWVDKESDELKAAGFPVCHPKTLSETDFDYCLIAVLDESISEVIKTNLVAMGIPQDKIVQTHERDSCNNESI